MLARFRAARAVDATTDDEAVAIIIRSAIAEAEEHQAAARARSPAATRPIECRLQEDNATRSTVSWPSSASSSLIYKQAAYPRRGGVDPQTPSTRHLIMSLIHRKVSNSQSDIRQSHLLKSSSCNIASNTKRLL